MSLALLEKASVKIISVSGLFGGRLKAGGGGGTRILRPHMVVRFATSRLFLNLKQNVWINHFKNN